MLRFPFRLDTGVQLRFALADFDSQPTRMNFEQLTKAKSLGFSDRQIAHLTGQTEDVTHAGAGLNSVAAARKSAASEKVSTVRSRAATSNHRMASSLGA